MNSNFTGPLNIGSDRLVTINEMVDIVSSIAHKNLQKVHLLDKPQGVRGRNSDNALLRDTLKWEPKVTLEEGLRETYYWIASQLLEKYLPKEKVKK